MSPHTLFGPELADEVRLQTSGRGTQVCPSVGRLPLSILKVCILCNQASGIQVCILCMQSSFVSLSAVLCASILGHAQGSPLRLVIPPVACQPFLDV